MSGSTVAARSFYKPLKIGYLERGASLAILSASLNEAGVPTPVGRLDRHARGLVFPWLYGAEVRHLIRSSCGMHGAVDALWTTLLQPLVRLHAVAPASLSLPEHDAMKHVSRRIGSSSWGESDDRLVPFHDKLRQAVREERHALSERRIVVHGDFHVGQVLVDSAAGTSWVVDIDDVALGVAEMDVGNLVAHLVTSPALSLPAISAASTNESAIDESYQVWCSRIGKRYESLSGTPLSVDRLRLYGAVAMLRRALKLAEAGVTRAYVRAILHSAQIVFDAAAGASMRSPAS